MQILPVLDVMEGKVVRGIGGRRWEYRTIVSWLTQRTDPVGVANDLRSCCGFEDFYVADLDAIMGKPPALAMYQALHEEKFNLWVDAGLRDLSAAMPLVEMGVQKIIAGLETIPGPAILEKMVAAIGSERLVFSLDLKNKECLGETEAWQGADPQEIARQAVSVGIHEVLVLDLARVGSGNGTGTEELCAWLAETYPHVRIAAGGGVAGIEDLGRLEQVGVSTVLIASALHDGRIRLVL